MKIEQFFKFLQPDLERKRIIEDIDQLREEIEKTLLPKLKESAELMGNRRFESTYASNFEGLFVQALPEYRQRGFFLGAQMLMTNLKSNIAVAEKKVLEWFAKDVSKETLTYQKAALLQYVQLASFTVDYTLRSLYRIVSAEALAAQGNAKDIDANLTVAEKKWFKDNETAYLDTLKVINVRAIDFEKMLEKIPQIVVVPENGDLVRQTVAASDLDPFRFGFIAPTSWNLIYQIRLVHSEAQVKRYRQKVEERRALEYRLVQWKEAQSGKNDPRLAQEIEYSEGRLQRLNYEIAEMQDRYSHA